MNKKFWISIIIIVIQLILAIYIGSFIEEDAKIPSHWNIQGEVDGYVSKTMGIYLFVGINIILLIIMIGLPYFSVRYKNAPQRFSKMVPIVTNIIIFFLAAIHVYILLIGAEKLEITGNFIFYALGLMFILLGNVIPKMPSSFFIGIRTPWTLSSELVWRKTHKLGGITFILSGLLMLIVPATSTGSKTAMTLMFVCVIILVLIPALYSFYLYKQDKK